MLLIYLVNMFGLFLQKIKKGVSIVNDFQKILDKSMQLHSECKPQCGLIKEVNFTIILLENG